MAHSKRPGGSDTNSGGGPRAFRRTPSGRRRHAALFLAAGTVAIGLLAGGGTAAYLATARPLGAGDPPGAAASASDVPAYVAVRVAGLPAAQSQFEGLRELDALLVRYRSALQASGEDYGNLAAEFGTVARDGKGSAADWARLVQADCLAKANRTTEAGRLWNQVASEAPQFAGYCRWRQGGKAALAAANHNEVRGGFGPDILVAAGEADPDPARAAAWWRQAIELAGNGPATERALYMLATRPNPDRAQYAARYLKKYPDGRYLGEVSRALQPGALSESERVELAGVLMDRGDYGPASKLLGGAKSGLAAYRLGRCTWKLGNPKKALLQLAEAQKRSPALKSKVLLTKADMAAQRRAWDEAVGLARVVARDTGPVGLEGLKLMVRTYLRADRDGEANWIDREILTRYPDSEAATESRWRILWKSYREGRMDVARTSAQGLAAQNGLLGAAGGFWLGRIEQDAGRTSAALAAYGEVVRRSPYTYYGWRSRFRAAALSGRAEDPGFAIQDGPVSVPHYDLHGLLPESERGFLDGRAGAPADASLAEVQEWPTDLRVLAYLGLAPADRLPPGRMRILAAHATGIEWAGNDPVLSNPLGYWPALESAARTNGLDPLFFAALVKQESYFDPRSRSWVGAMGLAQLMPFTADWVSRQIPGPRRPLTDPAYNMQLGSWYLAYAGRTFEGQPILATAAYNAGIGAAKRWRAWLGADPEEFIERIPYRETRHYVKKVYGYYWTYRWLYRDKAMGAAYGLPDAFGVPASAQAPAASLPRQ